MRALAAVVDAFGKKNTKMFVMSLRERKNCKLKKVLKSSPESHKESEFSRSLRLSLHIWHDSMSFIERY